MHPRVVNVRAPGAEWDVYVGRGRCPCAARPCPHATRVRSGPVLVRIDWSNPYKLADHGAECMRLFLDHVADPRLELPAHARSFLPGLVLGCWCAGRYPVCHAEVWAYLADGRDLNDIRAELLGRLGLKEASHG